MNDYSLGSTIYLSFTTRAFATGVPTALAGSPTLEIYENDSTSPIVEGASKLVLTQNLNSINGFNLATVTATSGNGFESGKMYHMILKTGTVGGTSVVGEVVGGFTIEAAAALRPTTAGRTLVVDANGLADANMVKAGPTGSGTAQTAGDLLAKILKYVQLLARKDAAIATDNGTELTAINANGGSGAGAYANTTDSQEAIRDKEADIETDTNQLQTDYTTARAAKIDNLDVAVSSRGTGAALDAEGIRTAVGMATANLDTHLDLIEGDASSAAVRSDAAAISADAASVSATNIQSRIPPALSVDGYMQSNVMSVNGSIDAAARMQRALETEVLGTCASSTTTSIVASGLAPASVVNDQFNGLIMKFDMTTITTALRGQGTRITDYDHATLTFTVDALTTAPVNGDSFVIV